VKLPKQLPASSRRSFLRANRLPWPQRLRVNPEAYDLFLKGEYQERQAESAENRELFDRAETSIGKRWRGIRVSRLPMRGSLTAV